VLLRAISFGWAAGPLRDGTLTLGKRITVLVGPNDSGKTRLLRAVETALGEPRADSEFADSAFSFYDDTVHEYVDLHGVATAAETAAFLHPQEAPHSWGGSSLVDISEKAIADGLRDDLEITVGHGEVPLAVRDVRFGDLMPAWRYGRALADLFNTPDLPDERRTIVEAAMADLNREAEVEQPLALDFLGGVEPSILPNAVVVPSPPGETENDAGGVVVRLCRALRCLNEWWEPVADLAGVLEAIPDRDWAPSVYPYELSDAENSPRWMLDETPGASTVHPAAIYACEVLQREAHILLPDFISDKYDLVIVPAHPSANPGRAIDIGLQPAGSFELEDPEPPFPLKDAASGFGVWLQLALREATARLDLLVRILEDGGGRARRALHLLAKDDPVDIDLAGLADVRAAVEAALVTLKDSVSLPSESAVSGWPSDPEGQFGPRWPPVSRSRLYLLDEPEQRLHPSLQRRAASWLSDLMAGWDAQCILATHSAAFIDMPGDDVCGVEVVRVGGSAALRRFDVAEFDPRSLLAQTMGFDRGEMLARWRAFLFVEGVGDVAVFEGLFRERLNDLRIRVLPVHGHRQHTGLFDMQVLAMSTTTPIAALLDGVSEAEIQKVRNSTGYRGWARSEPSEIGTVAKILDLEEEKRPIEILTIGVPDIFDLLDVESIRAVAEKREQVFPGHPEARDAFERSGGGNAASYKRFVSREYGVVVIESKLREIASLMNDKGALPRVLEDVLWRVDLLAAKTETA
jgi:predicted ATPase